jgi:hypothetical protein
MRRPWILGFAPLLFSATAAAQTPPLVQLTPVVVPISQPGPLPMPVPVLQVPVPVVQIPVPVPVPVFQAPPAPVPSYPPPVQEPVPPPPAWSPSELPPPAPPLRKKDHGVLLAVDLQAAWPVASPDAKTPGFGADFRVGYRFQGAAGPVWFAPLADIGFADFPKFDWALRFGAGGMLGLDAGFVEPSIYAVGGGFYNVWKSGPGVRAGAALDFRPGRFVMPGIHVDWNQAGWDSGSIRYVSTGVHVGFLLGKK